MSSGTHQARPGVFLLIGRVPIGLVCILLLSPGVWSDSSDSSHEPTAPGDSTVVATVGDMPITAASVRREMMRAGGHDPKRFDELEEKRAALEAVVRIEVLARAAVDAGYDEHPEIQDEFKRLLAQRFWADHQREKDPIRVTDEAIQAYYEEHQSEFERPVQVRGSIAFLRSRADASLEDHQARRQEAEKLANDVQQGRITFADLARRHSEDSWSRKRGGDVGWVTPGQRTYRWDKQVILTLSEMEQSEDRPRLVEADRGIYLVQLTGRRGGSAESLEHVRRQIEVAIVAEKQRAVTESDYRQLRDRYKLQVYEDRLEAVASEVSANAHDGPPSFPVGNRTVVPDPQKQGESGESLR